MKILDEIRRSIYDPEYYRELLQKPFAYSLRYFYTLVLIMTVGGTTFFGLRLVPRLQAFLYDLGPQIVANYPEELTVTINDGAITTTVPEPYVIKLPERLKEVSSKSDDPEERRVENLIVLDTKEPYTEAVFKDYHTYFLFSKNMFASFGKDGAVDTEEISKFPNITVSKEIVQSLYNRIVPWIKFITPAFVALTFVGIFLYIQSNLFYLLFGALIVWGIVRARKSNIGYKKSYQLSLHLATLSVFINSIATLLGVGSSIPYLFIAVFVVSVLLNISNTFPLPTVTEHPMLPSEPPATEPPAAL